MSSELLKLKAKACCCDERCEYSFTPCLECPESVAIGNFNVPCKFFPEEPSLDRVYVFAGECFQYSPIPLPHATILNQEPEDVRDSCIECCPPPILGACCTDPETSACQDGVTESECDTFGGTFYPNQTCPDIAPFCSPPGPENCLEIEPGDCPTFIFVTLPALDISGGEFCVCGAPPCTVRLELFADGSGATYTDATFPNPGCFGSDVVCPCCFQDNQLGLWNGDLTFACVNSPGGPCDNDEFPYWRLEAVADVGVEGNITVTWRVDALCPLGAHAPCNVNAQTPCAFDDSQLVLLVQ